MSRFKYLVLAIFVHNINIEKFQCLVIPDLGEGSGEGKDASIQTCLTDNKNPYTLFASKTTYLHPDIGNKNTDNIQLPGRH